MHGDLNILKQQELGIWEILNALDTNIMLNKHLQHILWLKFKSENLQRVAVAENKYETCEHFYFV